MLQRNIASISDLAEKIYGVPVRYNAEWLWWSTMRFVLQIVAVAYFLDKVMFEKFITPALEKRGESLLETLSKGRREIIVGAVVVLIGFALGHFAEKVIDRWMLPKYKRPLSRIVSDRSTRLWSTYNGRLKLLAQAEQALGDLEKQIAANSAEGPPT